MVISVLMMMYYLFMPTCKLICSTAFPVKWDSKPARIFCSGQSYNIQIMFSNKKPRWVYSVNDWAALLENFMSALTVQMQQRIYHPFYNLKKKIRSLLF